MLSQTYDRLTADSYNFIAAAPKALADMVEALAGAVLVDNGFSLDETLQVGYQIKP